jgi:GT2 family glycosyltransferase
MSTQNTLSPPSIAAIVVTRDRLALLKECIAGVRSQTHGVNEIIVVNNDSGDGTREWLAEQKDLTVIHQGNSGGAGGQHRGIKEAYAHGHDWFWCMDDDTIPQEDSLQKLVEAPYFRDDKTGFLGSLVQWTNGDVHEMNMFPVRGSVIEGRPDWYNSVLQDGCIPVTMSTFVSILISRVAVAKVGLPIKEFFIWCDDVEYTYRISRNFRNYHVLKSVVLHKTAANRGGNLEAVTPDNYGKLAYGLRNQVCFLRLESGAAPRKQLRIAYFILRNSLLILKNRAPLSLIGRLWAGLFFSPSIDMVDGSAARNDPSNAVIPPHAAQGSALKPTVKYARIPDTTITPAE